MAEKAKKAPNNRVGNNSERDYSRPHFVNRDEIDTAIEECKARVANGEKCYCAEVCDCRSCQKTKKENGSKLCDEEMLCEEGGCALGCNKCSNCKPCW